MRITLMAIIFLLPWLAFGQSLGELAKKEKERRAQNKQNGKTAITLSQVEISKNTTEDLNTKEPLDSETPSLHYIDATEEENDLNEGAENTLHDVPDNIPMDAPLETRIQLFQVMKKNYEDTIETIDKAIRLNSQRILQIEDKIRQFSASGAYSGAPVSPQMMSGDLAQTQLSGQESRSLDVEKKRLQAINKSMNLRKEQLKLNLQTKGRVANIPASYLRF